MGVEMSHPSDRQKRISIPRGQTDDAFDAMIRRYAKAGSISVGRKLRKAIREYLEWMAKERK
jgi:hypothetical protein